MENTQAFKAALENTGRNLAGSNTYLTSWPTPPEAHWAAVDRGVIPCPGESLRSIVARTCTANYLPNSWSLLKSLGLPNRNRVRVAEISEIDPEQLAFALCLPDSAVRNRRYEQIGISRDFFGLIVPRDEIVSQTRRFAPAFFRNERPQNRHRTHQALWELASLPFCLESWDMLQDRCCCTMKGTVQRWTVTRSEVDACDACGRPLKNIQSLQVPEEMRPALSILYPIVHPVAGARDAYLHLLPQQLRRVDRGRLYRMILLLADAINPAAQTRDWRHSKERLQALHLACQSLAKWPGELLSVPIAPSCSDTTRVRVRNEWYHLALAHGSHTEHVFNRPPADGPCSVFTTSDAQPRQLVGRRNAMRFVRMSYKFLSEIWHAGLVSKHLLGHGNSEVIAFDPDELIAFNLRWQSRIKLESVGYAFGISQFGVEQLVAMELLQADAPAVPGADLAFTPDNKDDFLKRLWNMRLLSVPDPVPLESVLFGIGGRPKPWGPIFRCLLGGQIEFCVNPTVTDENDLLPLPANILIPSSSAPQIQRLHFDGDKHPSMSFSQTVIQRDVFEWLNGTCKIKGLLKHLKTTGKMPLRYQFKDVDRLARKVATIPEVAYHLKRDVADVYWILKQAKIPQPFPKGWCRHTLMEKGFLPR